VIKNLFFKGKNKWKPGDKSEKKSEEYPEPMFIDPEDPPSILGRKIWEFQSHPI
jgi:hypothetical protein